MAKSGDTQKTVRVSEIVELHVSGASRADILKYAQTHGWGAATGTIDKYIKAAKVLIEKELRSSRGYRLNLAERRLNNLYARNISKKDYRAALLVQQEYNKLYGLHAVPTQSENDAGLLGGLVEAVKLIE